MQGQFRIFFIVRWLIGNALLQYVGEIVGFESHPDYKYNVMRSKVLQELIDEMEKDPWHVKLRRWCRLKIWVYKCRTRKYWDKTYQGYIFKKK